MRRKGDVIDDIQRFIITSRLMHRLQPDKAQKADVLNVLPSHDNRPGCGLITGAAGGVELPTSGDYYYASCRNLSFPLQTVMTGCIHSAST